MGFDDGELAVEKVDAVELGLAVWGFVEHSSGSFDLVGDDGVEGVKAVNAVEKAGSFPELSNLPTREFEKTFRRFRLLFRPEDLRY